MQNAAQKPLEVVREPLNLIKEMEQNYSQLNLKHGQACPRAQDRSQQDIVGT